jgi:hypothetical protein
MHSASLRLAFAVALTAALLGQARAASAQSEDHPHLSLAGSYAYLREQGIGGAPAVMYNVGWVADVDWRMGDRVALVGDIGGSYRSVQNVETQAVYGFLGGLRFGLVHAGPLRIFAQGLVGLERFGEPGFSEKGLAIQPGAGVDVAMTSHIGLRVQGDYRLAREEGVTFKEVRTTVGVVWHVGAESKRRP